MRVGHNKREAGPSHTVKDPSPVTEANEIYRKLEERAIEESNDLNHRVVHCQRCRRGDFMPTVGSGHPLADIFLLKYQPRYREVTEGVAFYGRSGTAVLKSVERLGINPLIVYGTNLVKCHDVDLAEGDKNCPPYWLEEFQITQPRIIVVMGKPTLDVLNRERVAGMKELSWEPGILQEFTPFCKALVTPDIDEALDEEQAKAAFWKAFRNLGDWFRDEPPY
ncbi:MAG: uracil-DNA glycosylase [Actinobacteria bacterium]|nr:uracil-DNA glycosylase [Actinomycetota bacterium]